MSAWLKVCALYYHCSRSDQIEDLSIKAIGGVVLVMHLESLQSVVQIKHVLENHFAEEKKMIYSLKTYIYSIDDLAIFGWNVASPLLHLKS